jgi:hypothetical protein
MQPQQPCEQNLGVVLSTKEVVLANLTGQQPQTLQPGDPIQFDNILRTDQVVIMPDNGSVVLCKEGVYRIDWAVSATSPDITPSADSSIFGIEINGVIANRSKAGISLLNGQIAQVGQTWVGPLQERDRVRIINLSNTPLNLQAPDSEQPTPHCSANIQRIGKIVCPPFIGAPDKCPKDHSKHGKVIGAPDRCPKDHSKHGKSSKHIDLEDW